ncbi:MAG TPA: HEAT repeat domain-containing protein, partial [Tepidisphaeraceae bacterium]|nr:HEAT repeat domain-containing protein [Tepidisphaeraceae bacterium]
GSDSAQNRRVAAEALGRIGDASVIPAIFQQLEQPNDRVLEHSLTYALIEIHDARAVASALDLRERNPRVIRAALMALDQMDGGHVDEGKIIYYIRSTDPVLRDTAMWIAARHPEQAAKYARWVLSNVSSGTPRPLLSAMQRLLAALSKSDEAADLMADMVANPNQPIMSRRFVLNAMSESHLRQAPDSWVESILKVLHMRSDVLIPDALDALRQVHLPSGKNPQLADHLRSVSTRENLPADVRVRALALIAGGPGKISDEQFELLTSQLDSQTPASQRLLAAQVLGRSHLSSDQLSRLADALKTAGPLEIEPLFTAWSHSKDDSVGMKLVDALKHAKSLTSLHPDVLQARLSQFGPEVQKQGAALLSKLNPDAAAQQARLNQLLAHLPPGDIRRGQALFNSSRLACSTCHAIGYVGGNVGPDLTRVGATRAPRDLLESIVFPGASFVQSFEPVMVITTSGDRQYGIPRRNDAEEITLITGPQQEVHIPRKDVQEVRAGTVSLMPAGFGDQLSPQELGDLIAFLKACR